MRRLHWLMLVFLLVLFAAACDSGDDDDSSDSSGEPGDDDDSTPAYSDPWNHEPDRPVVNVTTPQPGEFVTGAVVPVAGTVTGVAVDEVIVNDVAVPVVNGAFQTQVTFDGGETVLPIYITATGDDSPLSGARVVVIRGAMLPADQPVDDAFYLALGDQALTTINALLGNLLNDLDLMPLLEPLNPIIDNGTLTVEITAAAIGGADFQGAFLDNGFGFQGELQDVELGLTISLGALPIELNTTIGKLAFQGLADITVADGEANVTITNFSISHEDVTFEGSLPAAIGEGLINLILNTVEGLLENLMADTLPGLLETALADFSVQTTLIGFDLELGLAAIDIGAGGLEAGFDLNVSLTDPDPSLPWPRGSLSTPGAPPDFVGGRPPAAQDFGVGVALADDLLNRILLAAADSQIFDLAIGAAGLQDDIIPLALNAGTLALLFPSLGAVDPETPVSIVLHAEVPPVSLPGEDGSLWLNIPDWRMDVYLHPYGVAPWRAMELSLDATFAIDADAVQNALVLGFPRLTLNMLFIDNPLNEDAPLATFLADWLAELLGGLLDVIFSNLPIDIPALAGVNVDFLWMNTAGSNQDYWTAYLGLGYTPPAKLR
ncbi:MAG: hypothetical protein GX444_18615 [Myxococcales bacterium]|nr:hypothetical protein [Myxococcales bacterium]